MFCDESTKDYTIFTARKRSLRRLCFYRCLSVQGGRAWQEGCVWQGGHAWHGGMHGRGDMCGRGACMVRGACVAGGGRATADTTGYGQWAGGTHPTGMHSCSVFISCVEKVISINYKTFPAWIRGKAHHLVINFTWNFYLLFIVFQIECFLSNKIIQ